MQDSPASKGDNTTRENFQKAILFYEPTIARSRAASKLLDVPAMVIANLCVAYIMIEKNHEAEELMKAIEREEEAAIAQAPESTVRCLRHCLHQPPWQCGPCCAHLPLDVATRV